MTAMPMDPITAQRMLERLPEIQRRQRRAKRLRTVEDRFQAQADQDYELGSYAPGVQAHGNWHAIPGSYIPNHAAMGKQLVGAIGSFMTGRQAEKEDAELQGQLNPEILDTLQGMSQELPEGQTPDPNSPTEQTLRGYLGMLTGQEMKDVFGKEGLAKGKLLRKTEILDTGEIVNVYSDGTREKTGDKAKYVNRQWRNERDGSILEVPTSGMSGAKTVNMGGGLATPPFNPDAAPPAPPPGSVTAPPPGAEVAPEGHMVKVGNVSVDMGGMPAEAVQQVESTLNNLAALPNGEALMQQAAESFAVKAQQMREMGPGKAGGQAVTAGAPPPVGGPTPTESAVAGAMGVIQPQPGPPARLPTAYEIEMDREQGKIDAQTRSAPAIAQAAADKEMATRTATLDADAISAAKTAYPKAVANRRQAEREIARITGNRAALKNITGGSFVGRTAGVPWIGDELAKGVVNIFKGGKPEADTIAAVGVLNSEAFLQSYADALKGTGQISNIEGLRAAASNLQASLSQSEERFVERLAEFQEELQLIEERLKKAVAGDRSTGAAEGAAPKMDAARREELKNKYRSR